MFRQHPFLVRSLWRRTYEKVNPLLFPTIHVNEFPKSGGTWLCRMLSEILDRRFDDNIYPQFGATILKHHRVPFSLQPTIMVIRDPRDVAISYFHHMLKPFSDNPFNSKGVQLIHEKVFKGRTPSADSDEDLADFIRFMTTKPVSPKFTWGDFYRSHPDYNVMVRYEDMRNDTKATLANALDKVGASYDEQRLEEVINAHDIEKLLQKRKKEQKTGSFFIRQGKVGGWRDRLSAESIALIEEDAGDLLSKYGYS